MTSSREEVNDQISTWFKRAELAYQQKNTDLSRMCLQRRWQYQKELATIKGTAPPEESKEPNFYFGRDDPGDPDQPALVPRQPHPSSGAGEVAMPLPMKDSDNEA